MGDPSENRIFIENADTQELVWEGPDRVSAQKFLRSEEAVVGRYNILSRIELDVVVEPPRVTRGNKVIPGERFRTRSSKKGSKKRSKSANNFDAGDNCDVEDDTASV